MTDFNWWKFNKPDGLGFIENASPAPTPAHEWDKLFMRIAREVSKMSKCSSRQIGTVLVRDKDIISMGINGSPSGSELCQQGRKVLCPRRKLNVSTGQHLEICPAQHSEENAIHMAAKKGVSTKDTTAYMWGPSPCQRCAGALINAGIKRIVCLGGENYDDLSLYLLEECRIPIDRFSECEI